MDRRIFGTESEYAAVYHRRAGCLEKKASAGNFRRDPKAIAENLTDRANVLGIPMAGEFLGNGGRLYVDRGGHPEYATPECCRIADLVAHEIAGDRLIRDLTAAVNAGDGGGRLHLYKNNVDLYGHTYGGHENYLVTPGALDNIGRLLPFLVTRQIVVGAGKVMTVARDGTFGYQISQRADFFDCTYSDRTSEVRGIINIRKREIARADQGRRLHLILGDSSMAQVTLGLKIATTALMLRLLEAGALGPDFELLFPATALKMVSRNMDAKIAVRRHGRCGAYSALEVQSICLDAALRFFSANPPEAEEAFWLGCWEEILVGLKGLAIRQDALVLERDDADLKRKIDWVLKLWLLDRSRTRGANETQLKELDLKYHDLDPESGLYAQCLALDLVDRLVSESAIATARKIPPRGTRACLRGRIVRETHGKPVDVRVENWERIRIQARARETDPRHCFHRVKHEVNRMGISLEDPFQEDNPQAMTALRAFIETWGGNDAD